MMSVVKYEYYKRISLTRCAECPWNGCRLKNGEKEYTCSQRGFSFLKVLTHDIFKGVGENCPLPDNFHIAGEALNYDTEGKVSLNLTQGGDVTTSLSYLQDLADGKRAITSIPNWKDLTQALAQFYLLQQHNG